MQAAIVFTQIVAGFALIIFGAWVTWQGIRIITQYYPLSIKPGKQTDAAFTNGERPPNLVASMIALANAEISALADPVRKTSFVDLDNPNSAGESDGTPGGAGNPQPETGDQAGGDAEADTADAQAAAEAAKGKGTEKGSVLEGIAKVIEALPKLLNANFGPATVVCLVGLLIIAGGFYLLLQLNIGV